MKISAWLQKRKKTWYRHLFRKKLSRYYLKQFFTPADRYSIPAIPKPDSYVDGYSIFGNSLPALLTMSAINFFKFGCAVDAKKYAEEMWYCRKLVKKAVNVENESQDRIDAALKNKFGENTRYDWSFKKDLNSKDGRTEFVWSGYTNPDNLSKEKIEAELEEIVSDHVTEKNDPQFGPYDTPPCMRFLRWWD